MATIFDVASSVNRLNETLGKAYTTQLVDAVLPKSVPAQLLGGALGKAAVEPAISRMLRDQAKFQAQLVDAAAPKNIPAQLLGSALGKAAEPVITGMMRDQAKFQAKFQTQLHGIAHPKGIPAQVTASALGSTIPTQLVGAAAPKGIAAQLVGSAVGKAAVEPALSRMLRDQAKFQTQLLGIAAPKNITAQLLGSALGKAAEPVITGMMRDQAKFQAQLFGIAAPKGIAAQLVSSAVGKAAVELALSRMIRYQAKFQTQLLGIAAPKGIPAQLLGFFEPQFTTSVGDVIEPLLTDLIALDNFEPRLSIGDSVVSTGDQRLRKLSDKDVAVMLTIAVFILTYFSLSLLIKYSAQAAEISAIDGPMPFEAAMGLGALTYALKMDSGRPKNK